MTFLNIKKESVKQESGKEANHVEVKKEVKTELKEESVKKEVKEECVKTEVKEETKCGVSNGTDDEEVNEEQDKQQHEVRYDVIRKIKQTHDSVLKIDTLENKLVCRARHPLPPNQRVDDFLERTKLKKEEEERELQQQETDKEKSTFIPIQADEELIDVSAITANAIAAVMTGKVD